MWRTAGWHFGHSVFDQASEPVRQIVPPWPGFRMPFGVSSKPSASPGTGIHVFSWSRFTWSLLLRLICPTLNSSSTAETRWQNGELASGGKIPLEVKGSQALGKRINSLSHWEVSLSGDGIRVGRWASRLSVGGGLHNANGMWVWSLMQVQRGRGWSAQQCRLPPRESQGEANLNLRGRGKKAAGIEASVWEGSVLELTSPWNPNLLYSQCVKEHCLQKESCCTLQRG